MEHSALAIAAFLEAGCSTDLQDWSWDHGVGGTYATDCWHISRINVVLAVSYSFLADGHVCCATSLFFSVSVLRHGGICQKVQCRQFCEDCS